MADFSTILSPSNETLDLYCRSINTKIIKSQAYANLQIQIPVNINTDNQALVIPFVSTISNNIILDQNLLIKFNEDGIYSTTICINATNTTVDAVNLPPNIGLYINVYNSAGNLIQTSPTILTVSPYDNGNQIGIIISNNFIFRGYKNGYITVVATTSQSSAPYNVTIFTANLTLNELI